MPKTIDLSKPIEAVRFSDGKVVALKHTGPFKRYGSDEVYGFETDKAPNDGESNTSWHLDGRDYCSQNKWYVRNVNDVEPTDVELAAKLRKLKNEADKVAQQLTDRGYTFQTYWGAQLQFSALLSITKKVQVEKTVTVEEVVSI